MRPPRNPILQLRKAVARGLHLQVHIRELIHQVLAGVVELVAPPRALKVFLDGAQGVHYRAAVVDVLEETHEEVAGLQLQVRAVEVVVVCGDLDLGGGVEVGEAGEVAGAELVAHHG